MLHTMTRLLASLLLFAAVSAAAAVPPKSSERLIYPRTRIVDGYSIVMHAPQIRAWPDFAKVDAWMVLEVTHPDGKRTDIGSVVVTGQTNVYLDRRAVMLGAPRITDMHFKSDIPAPMRAAIEALPIKEPMAIPLDLFLAYLADDVLSTPPPAGFNFEPPVIQVAAAPTLLLIVRGEPVLKAIENSPIKQVVNANGPVFQDSTDGHFYLFQGKQWLTATALTGPWQGTQAVPGAFAEVATKGTSELIKAALPPAATGSKPPAVIVSDVPAELIVTDGAPALSEIAGSDGLKYVTNTESPLFRLGVRWYFLAAGRWFMTDKDLARGPWKWQETLPEAFSRIPGDHPMAYVRVSVAGTPEARMAALEASLPTRTTVSVGSAPPVTVSYGGEPKFEPVTGTALARAVNTGYDVLRLEGRYYLCYAGIWYEGPAPAGPWKVSSNVPAAIYAIPPTSPSYHVTQVKVQQSSSSTIVYTYPPSYSSGIYVAYGVPYYGTGWYYAPWAYAGYYYPYYDYDSYGYGSWHNSATGRYGETYIAADGDELASYGQSYNPRTGVYSLTGRHYDESQGELQMARYSARGDEWMETTRTTDLDSQVSNTERTTSRGGESNVSRSWSDGQLSTSGTVKTGDGRTATIEGSHGPDGGTTTISGSGGGSASINREVDASGNVSRDGTVTRNGETLSTQTQRSGANSATEFQTSGGASGKSVSTGPGNRLTVGQSGSGDLYAARDGEVYKKSGDSWQAYDNGAWRPADSPARSAEAQGAREQLASSRDLDLSIDSASLSRFESQQRLPQGGYGGGYDRAQLDRDFRSRQSGMSGYERGGSFDRGNYNRGSFSRGSGSWGGGGGFSRGGGGGMRRR